MAPRNRGKSVVATSSSQLQIRTGAGGRPSSASPLFGNGILANGAEVYVGEVIAQAKALGIAARSVTRAKGRLTIFMRKKSRNGRPASFWCLERKTPQLDEFLAGLPKG